MHGEHFKATIFIESHDGSIFVNNWGYGDLTSGSAAHVDTVTAATAFQTLVQGLYQACLPDDAQIFQYRFSCEFGSHFGEIGYLTSSLPVAGSLVSTDNLPNEICISLKRSTGFAARTERGRIFLSPVSFDLRDIILSDPNRCKSAFAPLQNLSAALGSDLTVAGTLLKPILLDSLGDSTEHPIIHTTYALQFVHRRSRRPTVGS